MTPTLAVEAVCVALTAAAGYVWGWRRHRAAYPDPPDIVLDITPVISPEWAEFSERMRRFHEGWGVTAAAAAKSMAAAFGQLAEATKTFVPSMLRLGDSLAARGLIDDGWWQGPFERDLAALHRDNTARLDTFTDALVVTR